MPNPEPYIPLLDLLFGQWESELLTFMGGGQHIDEGIISYICRINQIFRNTIRADIWGLSEKQVLFARKYMNDDWRQLTNEWVWNPEFLFNYEKFIRALERQANIRDPSIPAYNPSGIGAFPTALPSEATIWGVEPIEETLGEAHSSNGSNGDLTFLADEATSRAVGDDASTT